MIILWGFRSRLSNLGTGQFFCPRCGGDREYIKQGVRRWFTLFFVPLFPISGRRSVHICCTTCKGRFAEQVLGAPAGEARIDAERTAFLQCAIAVLTAGDQTSQVARETLHRVLAARGIGAGDDLPPCTPDQIAVYMAPIAQQLSNDARESFFGDCGAVAMADGGIDDAEATALRVLGESLNLSAAHRTGILQMVRDRQRTGEA